MRVVHFTHCFPPDIGGVQLAVYHTARAMAAHGHDVTVVTESRGGACDGCRVEELHVAVRRPLTRVLYWRWMWRRRALFRGADVLHFHDYGTFLDWFLPFRFVFRRALFVMTFHGFDGWPIRIRHRVQRAVSARLMHVTFATGSFLRRFYGHRIDHIVLGAPVREPARFLTRRSNDYLYIGRLEPDTMIAEVAECLASSCAVLERDATLTVIGDGPCRERIAACASPRLRVRFLPSMMDLGNHLESASFVIAPGFLTLFDALLFRTVVILAALNDIKREYFASVPDLESRALIARDREELQAVFRRCLSDPNDAELDAVSERGRQYARSLSWSSVAQQYEQSYAARR